PVRFRLELPQAGEALLEIFDVRGARVRTLLRGAQSAGRQDVAWDGRADDGSASAPGLYLVRARAGGEARTVRVARLR
ncbi:MAG: FlgD immunoglobulin-like domain containing protein, partial [Candidatus Eisenbacteria bacterium]